MIQARIEGAIRTGSYQVAGPINMLRNQIRGGRNNYPSRGAGWNSKAKANGRNSVQAHTKGHILSVDSEVGRRSTP